VRQDDLDRILSEEEEIIPSSGFTASVMDSVRREAAAPPPIPFPWKRALPGLAAAAFALISLFFAAVDAFVRGNANQGIRLAVPPALASLVEAVKATGAGWIALSLILTLVSMTIAMRVAQRKL
jgi:hypothetical protein